LTVSVSSEPTLDEAYERCLVDATADLVGHLQDILRPRSGGSRIVVIVRWKAGENPHLCEAAVGAVRGLVLSVADEVAPSDDTVPPAVLNVIVGGSIADGELQATLDYLASPEAGHVSAATLRLEIP
jgi:hypothetical protein